MALQAVTGQAIRGDVPATRPGVVCLAAIVSKKLQRRKRRRGISVRAFLSEKREKTRDRGGDQPECWSQSGAQPPKGVSALWIRNPTSGGAERIVKP